MDYATQKSNQVLAGLQFSFAGARQYTSTSDLRQIRDRVHSQTQTKTAASPGGQRRRKGGGRGELENWMIFFFLATEPAFTWGSGSDPPVEPQERMGNAWVRGWWGVRETEEESGKTSKASDGCFIKASLRLLGIPAVYLASFILPLCFPKGATGNVFPPNYTSEVYTGTHTRSDIHREAAADH